MLSVLYAPLFRSNATFSICSKYSLSLSTVFVLSYILIHAPFGRILNLCRAMLEPFRSSVFVWEFFVFWIMHSFTTFSMYAEHCSSLWGALCVFLCLCSICVSIHALFGLPSRRSFVSSDSMHQTCLRTWWVVLKACPRRASLAREKRWKEAKARVQGRTGTQKCLVAHLSARCTLCCSTHLCDDLDQILCGAGKGFFLPQSTFITPRCAFWCYIRRFCKGLGPGSLEAEISWNGAQVALTIG